MDIKITIETWNDNWRFEIEDKSEGEIVKTDYGETFTECAGKCLEYIVENADKPMLAVDVALCPVCDFVDTDEVCEEHGIYKITHAANANHRRLS